eukprot:CAMPEP_0182809628 /NCGR_PEP_ID=MMETSP0006_2-20121128/7285_1 /TAXON_ID=97485 /ORGANISM="Prymnesium parvum, Strain Texoma1" /LENGTH=79 /DNA_ID=CAMNT_0024935425 /DNA_START=181 /DNA_END=417 /DNA_ORIENTATION=+
MNRLRGDGSTPSEAAEARLSRCRRCAARAATIEGPPASYMKGAPPPPHAIAPYAGSPSAGASAPAAAASLSPRAPSTSP